MTFKESQSLNWQKKRRYIRCQLVEGMQSEHVCQTGSEEASSSSKEHECDIYCDGSVVADSNALRQQ